MRQVEKEKTARNYAMLHCFLQLTINAWRAQSAYNHRGVAGQRKTLESINLALSRIEEKVRNDDERDSETRYVDAMRAR